MIVTYNEQYKSYTFFRNGIALHKEPMYRWTNHGLETVGEYCRYDGTSKYDSYYIKRGWDLHPTIAYKNVEDDREIDKETLKFFTSDLSQCPPCNYTGSNVSTRVIYDGDLNVMFGDRCTVIFYKDLDYVPQKKIFKFKTLSKSAKRFRAKWGIYEYEMNDKFSRYYKDGYYTVEAYDFKSDSDFVVFRMNPREVSCFCPEVYRGIEDKSIEYDYSKAAEYLQSLEPFNTSRDYDWMTTEERAAHNEKLRQQQLAEEARLREIEERKNTPGYCCYCGSEHASYVANPFYEEMYGSVVMQWLCSNCYNDCCAEV